MLIKDVLEHALSGDTEMRMSADDYEELAREVFADTPGEDVRASGYKGLLCGVSIVVAQTPEQQMSGLTSPGMAGATEPQPPSVSSPLEDLLV